ncbi:MAG TPA: hypothetical protein VJU14_05745 [Solirubrobacterales bacterium]|nr:hypothetical protein [Solirubrobacterales bacterium]
MRAWKGGFLLALIAVLASGVLAAPAGAAATVHPAGGGQFSGGPKAGK